MVKELDQEVANYANKYGVRLHSPINGQSNKDDECKLDASDKGEEQLTLSQFKELLRATHVL